MIQSAIRAHKSEVLLSFEMRGIDQGRSRWKAIPRQLVSPPMGSPDETYHYLLLQRNVHIISSRFLPEPGVNDLKLKGSFITISSSTFPLMLSSPLRPRHLGRGEFVPNYSINNQWARIGI